MFKSKLFVALVFLSFASIIFLPVFTFTYLYPSINKLLVNNAEEEAKSVATHFTSFFDVPEDSLKGDDITAVLTSEIEEIVHSFSLEKVKIFSGTGEILYSTDPADRGKINTKDYFRTLVLRGKNFTKIVRKDSKTLEGRTVSADVIETYVPIVGRDKVVGAFEIYYDITKLKGLFSGLIYRSALIIYGLSCVLVAALLVSLFKLSKNMNARLKAEQELARYSDELGEQVQKRTEELTAANLQLKNDITKRLQVEKALQVSEEKYRSLVDMAGDPIFIADAETGIITDVNRKGIELVGREIDEIIGMHLSELHPKDEIDLLRVMSDDHTDRTMPFSEILHVQHKNGHKIPVEVSSSYLDYGGQKMIQGIYRDISMRLQIEEELQKSEKFETASILASGIAHDFNNLLTAVMGNISLAKMASEDNEKVYKRLSDTEFALSRAKDLTHQLLTFAKGNVPVKKTVALGKVIEDSAKFVLRGTRAKCECDISSDLWNTDADTGQINQVISNLVINACHAMEGGGNCVVKAVNIAIDDANKLMLSPGKYIKIEVQDEGHGISPDKIDKIFDPFFTTKEHGSGLGLSSSYSIIKNHGGLITVQSTPGKGSTFIVYLPATDKEPVDETPSEDEDIRGTGKVLIMDDEEIVRDAVTSLLEYLGYQVETAAEGRETLEKYIQAHTSGVPFDVVIMDLTIPGGMGGREAVRELRKYDPDARVIVSSGYNTDPIMAHHEKYGFDGVVPKPYQLEDLGRAVKEIISLNR